MNLVCNCMKLRIVYTGMFHSRQLIFTRIITFSFRTFHRICHFPDFFGHECTHGAGYYVWILVVDWVCILRVIFPLVREGMPIFNFIISSFQSSSLQIYIMKQTSLKIKPILKFFPHSLANDKVLGLLSNLCLLLAHSILIIPVDICGTLSIQLSTFT